ncbi:MAG: DNA-protecting protein DprA [Thermoguttaceae bacterium]|nr:DNA-protecting protein DprA [Thermoguttaceae bacterium]
MSPRKKSQGLGALFDAQFDELEDDAAPKTSPTPSEPIQFEDFTRQARPKRQASPAPDFFAEDDAPTETPKRRFEPEEIIDEIILNNVAGVGPRKIESLLARFGSETAILDAPRQALTETPGIGDALARELAAARQKCDPGSIVHICRENEIAIISINDERYPKRLLNVATPPRLLYVRGEFEAADEFAIAVVGTRAISEYGKRQTRRLTQELVQAGYTIVSGLALGVDGEAHRAALENGGRTIAVLGSGLLKVYPTPHEGLARQIAGQGAVISEYHPLMTPLSGNFPARNRIVCGLSLGVLVVESGAKGGALITARMAAEQNRELFAVPGSIDSPTSRGCHKLIREGAKLVESVDDIVNALPEYARPANIIRAAKPAESAPRRSRAKKTPATSAPRELPPLDENEQKIVETLRAGALQIDALIQKTGLNSGTVVALVGMLEFKRVLRRSGGNKVELR